MKNLLLFLVLLVLALPAKGQTVDMSLQPSATIGLGGVVDIQILVVADTNHVDTVEADLNFPAAVLQVVSITPATIMGGGGTTNFDNVAGQVNIALSTTAAYEAQPGNATTWVVATVRFQSVALSAGATISFNTTSPRISAASLVGVPYAGSFGTATIVVSLDTPTPTAGRPSPTPTPSTTPSETATGVPSTPTTTPTSTPTPSPVTQTPTPTHIFTARPTATVRVLDCCDCGDICLAPTNGACPRGCTLVRNACCDCIGGGEQPAPTRTQTPAQ